MDLIPPISTTVSRRGASSSSEKVVSESEEALTVDDIQAFERSDYVKRCIAIIDEVSRGQPCKKTQFVDVRDYLTTILTPQNDSRTGVVKNVRMEDFAKAKMNQDGNFVVPMHKHKTMEQYGPAHLIFQPHIYIWLYPDIRGLHEEQLCWDLGSALPQQRDQIQGIQPWKADLRGLQGSKGEDRHPRDRHQDTKVSRHQRISSQTRGAPVRPQHGALWLDDKGKIYEARRCRKVNRGLCFALLL